jgi:Lrp/AsnC family leucine-responsive transcriptional regulator
VGLAPSAVGERIRRLKKQGTIQGFETRIDPKSLGYNILAFISITERKPTGRVRTEEVLRGVTGVEEVHKIAGNDCFLMKIRARDTDALNEILEREINPIPSISGTATTIVLKTIKDSQTPNRFGEFLEVVA